LPCTYIKIYYYARARPSALLLRGVIKFFNINSNSIIWECDRRGSGRIYLADRSIGEAARRSKRDARQYHRCRSDAHSTRVIHRVYDEKTSRVRQTAISITLCYYNCFSRKSRPPAPHLIINHLVECVYYYDDGSCTCVCVCVWV